jgi:hypothetical protein
MPKGGGASIKVAIGFYLEDAITFFSESPIALIFPNNKRRDRSLFRSCDRSYFPKVRSVFI